MLGKILTYWTSLFLEDVAEECPDLWAEDHKGLQTEVDVLEANGGVEEEEKKFPTLDSRYDIWN